MNNRFKSLLGIFVMHLNAILSEEKKIMGSMFRQDQCILLIYPIFISNSVKKSYFHLKYMINIAFYRTNITTADDLRT